MVKIDISAEPATPPEQGVKVHVRKGADMIDKAGYDVSIAKFYQTIEDMRDEDHTIQIIGRIHIHANKRGGRADVYVLTPEGKLSAEAIRRRAT